MPAQPKNPRTELISIRVSEDELKLIDDLRDKIQSTTIVKVSRADAILRSISFSTGQMFANHD